MAALRPRSRFGLLLFLSVLGTACGRVTPTLPPSDPHALLGKPLAAMHERALGTGERLHFPQPSQVLVVDFWSTSCRPCERLMPQLEKLSHDIGAVRVLGIAHDDNPVAVREKASALGVSYPIVLDDDGHLDRAFQVGGRVPTTFVVDGRGVVRFVRLGESGSEIDAIRAAVRAALDGS